MELRCRIDGESTMMYPLGEFVIKHVPVRGIEPRPRR